MIRPKSGFAARQNLLQLGQRPWRPFDRQLFRPFGSLFPFSPLLVEHHEPFTGVFDPLRLDWRRPEYCHKSQALVPFLLPQVSSLGTLLPRAARPRRIFSGPPRRRLKGFGTEWSADLRRDSRLRKPGDREEPPPLRNTFLVPRDIWRA